MRARSLSRRDASRLLAGAVLAGADWSLSTGKGRAESSGPRDDLARAGLLASGIERCAKDLLLVALEIATDERLGRLSESRDRLDRLVYAQIALGAERQAPLTALWPAYDDLILGVLERRRAASNTVAALAEIREPLSGAALDQFEAVASRPLTSPRNASLIRAYREILGLHRAAQKIASDFLLLVYGGGRSVTPAALTAAGSALEAGLEGLIHGDPQRRLVPAPTPAIRSQLQAAQNNWLDCRRDLVDSAWGHRPRRLAIEDFAQANDRLSVNLDHILQLYDAL